jgi:FMN-dependent NADH-azoreductase
VENAPVKLLHLDSSILGANSVTRALSADIVARQRALHPGLEVVYRDLAAEPPMHLTGAHLAAWQGGLVADPAVAKDAARGDADIDELMAADIIVIGAPMYNFTVPTQLKGWVDRIVVAGKTFRYAESGPVSLLPQGKKVIVASARGGVYAAGRPSAAMDHHETYLLSALGFIGLTDVTVVRAEGLALSPDARTVAIAKARGDIEALAA